MLRNLLFTIGFVLATSLLVFSQTGSGTLKGKITDKQTKEPISFANVVVEAGGVQVGGTTSDFDGNFTIKPIPPGKVDLKASFVGYKPFMVRGIYVSPDKITFQNLELEASTTTLNEIEVVDYKVPLISKDQTSSGATVTSEEISKMANKSASAVATTVGGVSTNANGEITSMRGQRSSGTVYYVDGMRVSGTTPPALPQSAIEQVEVILGGTPAAYGDATGGVINVTTKGPSKVFSGGVDLQSSQYLDAFGYNRLGLNFSGPVISKKDTVHGYKTPIMGFFLSGDLIYQKDGSPAAFPLYKVKDDVLQSLSKKPLRLYGQNNAVFYNSEFLTFDQMETTKHTLNSAGTHVTVSGKLDFRVTPSINLSFGGNFTWNDTRNFSFANSLMNWDNNSHTNNYTWRVFGRFTQRFPTAPDSKSFVKNIYYSIGADYTSSFSKTEDAQHKNNYFQYGYVGSFATQTIRAFTPNLAYDSVAKKWAHLQNGKSDTIVIFKGSDLNPESSNWTQQYFDLFDNPIGHYRNSDEILSGKGLLNGMEPTAPYGGMNGNLSAVGNRPNGYVESSSNQIAVNASFAADFGNHEIQLGLQYQQRKSAFYQNVGISLWELMKGLTNKQLEDLDLANPELIYRNGVFMDTINYNRKYVPTLQRNFDINLRKKLGLPVDGTDMIDVYSYNFATNSINYYDKNMQLHTVSTSGQLFSMDMFNADEVLANGAPIVTYAGYDYTGKKLSGSPSFDDFFTATDANGNFTRTIGAYQPIYMAGYIQDKFAFKDLIFNIGVRVDRFDANQPVLKDSYLFYPAKTVGEVPSLNGQTVNHPAGMGSDYVVYVDDANSPTEITGYRSNSNWFNAAGSPITDPVHVLDRGNGVQPYLVDPSKKTIQADVFKDYDPQTNWMPRIAFSFPISDDALFYAHYDILTQRPSSAEVQIDPISYYFVGVTGSSGTINNPSLKPEKTIDYELGFQQKINNSSSLKLSLFYREMRDQIQQYRLTGAYPRTYYSYTNIDFGTVKGLTITYDLRRSGNARLRFSYTLQFADGTGSDANTASAIIRSDQPNLRTLNPLSFDQRHQLNVSFDYRWGRGKEYNGPVINRKKSGKAPVQILSNLGANFTLNGGSGTPYTKSSQILPFGTMGRIAGSQNGARLPWQFLISARFDKDFIFPLSKKKEGTINVYIEFANLLNTRNVVNVYPATGTANDDGFLSASEWQNAITQQVSEQSFRDLYSIQMDNPYRYSSPRTIRLGVMFNF